jgi:hypothetical protein
VLNGDPLALQYSMLGKETEISWQVIGRSSAQQFQKKPKSDLRQNEAWSSAHELKCRHRRNS